MTGGRFDQSHPGISTSSWVRNYGAAGAHQYDRLAKAIALDRRAALESASWGMFQIMGGNFAACGFADVDAFVAAIVESEMRHLKAFIEFCQVNRLDGYLRTSPPNFAFFARLQRARLRGERVRHEAGRRLSEVARGTGAGETRSRHASARASRANAVARHNRCPTRSRASSVP